MEFLHNNKKNFAQAIDLVVSAQNLRFDIVEKDYYVTMLLNLISERLPFIVFKGGTSLSKCYKVIKRFSEDIDITIDTVISQKQKKEVKKTIEEVSSLLGLSISNIDETYSRHVYNRYEIEYNSVQKVKDFAVQPMIFLETSYTAISFPVVELDVHNYIGEMMTEEAPDYIERYQLSPFKMKVQGLDRTLVDKVFAVCDYYLQGKTNGHSRHLYDICKLFPLVPQNKEFKNLVRDVRGVRSEVSVCPSAQKGISISFLLNKIINEQVYRKDYNIVTEKLLEENMNYNEAIGTLKIIADSEIFD